MSDAHVNINASQTLKNLKCPYYKHHGLDFLRTDSFNVKDFHTEAIMNSPHNCSKKEKRKKRIHKINKYFLSETESLEAQESWWNQCYLEVRQK